MDPSKTVASDKRTRTIKRVALTSLNVIGLVLASIIVLLGVATVLLKTNWGGERLRRTIVSSTNQAIQGQLEIGRLSFGGDRLIVWNVVLRDPDGKPVAQVARVEVAFQIVRLLRKEVRVTAFMVESPKLELVSDSRGLNISRATAPRKKSPKKEEPPTIEEGWVIRLDRFDLSGGLVTFATASETATTEKLHLADLASFMSVRYATGNRSVQATFRLNGRSALTPKGPFSFAADARSNDQATRLSMNGELLGGTLKVEGNQPAEGGMEQLTADIKVAIPKQDLAGFDWGPFRIDGQARPGAIPKLDVLLAIPGVELSGKDANAPVFDFKGRLAVADLALTGKAVHALAGGDMPSLAGHGHIAFGVGGPMKGAPATWNTHFTGKFDRLRFAENVISDLTLDGRVTPLSNPPKEVDFNLGIASLTAGTTTLGKLKLGAKLRQQEISAEAQVASPEQITLGLAGRLDDDQQGFALMGFSFKYPQAQWALKKTAQIRFAGETVSLTELALLSQEHEQEISIEGSKTSDKDSEEKREVIDAHLAIKKLRLDQLPALAVDPKLKLAGLLDVDVKADGEMSTPKVVARVVLKQARFQNFSRLYAKVDATLAERQIDSTLSLEAPFTAVEGKVKLPMDPLVPGAPLDIRFDITKLDLGEALRAAAVAAPVDGKLTSRIQLSGSADNPAVDVLINARDLAISRPATAVKGPEEIDVGKVRVHLTYARRNAGADIDFTATQGGTVKVDAGARVDLSYPRVTKGIVTAKIPISGKVVAKDFDVAWVSRFNERLETLAGKVSIDAKLAGTVGDPQFIGDVRWKDGKVVATVPKPSAAAKRKQKSP